MRATLIALTLIIFSGKPSFASEISHHLKAVVEYQNYFKTFGELMNEMEAFGGLSRTERSGIESFLKSKSLGPNTRLTKARIDRQTVIWGSQRLTWQPDGSLRTKNGRIFRSAKSEARDALFKQTFSALIESGYTRTSPLSLAIEQAQAQQANNVDDAATAAMGTTLFKAMTAVSVPFCGTVGVALDGLLWWSKKLMYEGTVNCVDGEYTMSHYDEFWRKFKTDYVEAPQRNSGVTSVTDKTYYSVCYGPFARAIGNNPELPESRNRRNFIPSSSLQGAFPGKSVPECNKNSARIVQAFLKKKITDVHVIIEAAAKQARFSFDSTPGQTDNIKKSE